MKSEEQAIRQLHDTWIAAVNAGDLERLLAMIADDLVLINPEGAPMGREGFVEKFSGAHQLFHIDCRSALKEVVVAGDVAYTHSHDTLAIAPKAGGEAVHLAGYRLPSTAAKLMVAGSSPATPTR